MQRFLFRFSSEVEMSIKTAFHLIEASVIFLKVQAIDQDKNPLNRMNESNMTLVSTISELSDTYVEEVVSMLTLIPWADGNKEIISSCICKRSKPFDDRVLKAFTLVWYICAIVHVYMNTHTHMYIIYMYMYM